MKKLKTVGIDLSGKKKNPSGLATTKNKNIRTEILYSTEKIVEKCLSENPNIISIDAPLNFPKNGNFRKSDRELIKKGYHVLPPTFSGMKSLTARGIKLSQKLEEIQFKVIEVHPLTTGLRLFNTKKREKWISKLSNAGWRLEINSDSDHEIDAAMAAITGFLHLKNETEKIGNGEQITIIPNKEVKVL